MVRPHDERPVVPDEGRVLVSLRERELVKGVEDLDVVTGLERDGLLFLGDAVDNASDDVRGDLGGKEKGGSGHARKNKRKGTELTTTALSQLRP